MPKGNTIPLLDAGVKDKGQSNPTGEQPCPPRSLPRMSVFAAVKIPYLRRLEGGDGAYTHKTPLLTLRLSSHSFLDSTLKDDLSPFPLYTIKTAIMTTSIVRADPWDARTKTADIKWPKIVPTKSKGKNVPDGVLVQLRGSRWKGGDSFLKPSASKNGPRKFRLPHYSHSMKWQKHGSAYWCTTSPVKGPIAVFDPPVDTLPGRLTVYETLHDKYETSPMLVHQGVSILLLDYLLVTCILLVTDVQEWMVVQGSNPGSPTGDFSPSAGRQWRKIAHREPLFPKLSPVTTQTTIPGDFDSNSATTTSQEQMAKIVHGDPLYPRLQQSSVSQPSNLSESEAEDNGNETHSLLEVITTRSPSPSAESFLYPVSEMSAPSHTFIDPSFYLDQRAPPVPPIPSHYASQARSSSPVSTKSRRIRELPVPPPLILNSEASNSRISHSQPLVESTNQVRELDSSASTIGPADASLWKRRPSEPILTRARSLSRPLPRTPLTPSADGRDPVIRRVQSHTRINQNDIEKPWLSSAPPLPPLPITSTTPMTPRPGRSLPPTPLDLAMGRTMGGSTTRVDDTQFVRKSYESDQDSPGWVQMLTGQHGMPGPAPPRPSFDHPPPAYTAIDFHAATSQL